MKKDNKNTIHITTYQLVPYFSPGDKSPAPDSEWFREEINKLVRENRQNMEEKKADFSYFYNHDPGTGHTRVGYPLIIYHWFGGRFYLTGINEGAWALNCLTDTLNHPFKMGDVFFDGLTQINDIPAFLSGTAPGTRKYHLIEWIPFHHREFKSYRNMNLVEKAAELNKKLKNHISGEMGKYLDIRFENLEADISDLPVEYSSPVIFKGYEYGVYDILFSTNAVLPPFLTLGNNKSMGYGRIVPL